MNIAQIEEKISILRSSFDKEKFIYDFLLTYGLPKASITRLKKGNLIYPKKKMKSLGKRNFTSEKKIRKIFMSPYQR